MLTVQKTDKVSGSNLSPWLTPLEKKKKVPGQKHFDLLSYVIKCVKNQNGNKGGEILQISYFHLFDYSALFLLRSI